MIHVLAIIIAKPGMRERILDAYRANVDTRARRGRLPALRGSDRCGWRCDRGRAQFGADTFVVVEKWASVEALQAHAIAPHMKAYSSQVKDLTVASRAIHVLGAGVSAAPHRPC